MIDDSFVIFNLWINWTTKSFFFLHKSFFSSFYKKYINPLSANPQKCSNTLKQFTFYMLGRFQGSTLKF